MDYMQRAFELAEKGRGFVNPNPLVGAVIVRNGTIIGEGYHAEYGGPHAEVNAIRDAGDCRHATMHVTLEPCSHHGKTPPCTDAIIDAGIEKVIIASKDPNPEVAGSGVEKLRNAGIEVEADVDDARNRELNAFFFHYIKKGTPFVMLKTAMSADGKIATRTGDSKWITNAASRQFAHELRHRAMAIMVGAGTVLADDPRLTSRIEGRETAHPVRIILDRRGDIGPSTKIFSDDAETIIVTSRASKERMESYERAGAEVLHMPEKDGAIDLSALMRTLGARGIDSVLLEGGSRLNESALRAGIVHRAYVFIAPKFIGGKRAPTPLDGTGVASVKDACALKRKSIDTFEGDVLITYDIEVVQCSQDS